jgi:hypothetical protein
MEAALIAELMSMGAGWKQNWSSVARILGRSTHLKLHHAAVLLPVGLMTPVGLGPRQLAVVELGT